MSERNVERRKFLKWMARTSAAALLLATRCVPDKEKAQHIPLEELIAHPEIYEEVDNFATAGFPMQIDEQLIMIPILQCQKIGSTQMCHNNWITTKREMYTLHTRPSIESPSISFSTSETTFMVYAPLVPSGADLPNKQYEITGKLHKIKIKNGDQYEDKYSIDVFTYTPVVTPTPPSTQK